MKMIDEAEAKLYVCCTTQRECQGSACMAWQQEMKTEWIDRKIVYQTNEGEKVMLKADPVRVPSGRGWCGMVPDGE
jgi:hypothetical protein